MSDDNDQTGSELNIDELHDNRIGVYQGDDRRFRTFHVTGPLTNCGQHMRITDAKQLRRDTDQPTRQFVETLLAIPGIQEIVAFETHQMIVEIHSLYTWDQLQEQIIAAILKRLEWTPDNTSVVSYDDFQKAAAEHDKGSLPPNRLP